MTADTSRCSQHSSNASSASLRNPHKFNIKLEMDGKYYNLWSTDNDRTDANDDKVIKSVYDPSPVGYSLPASNAFTGFTTTGQQVGNWTIPATSEQVNAKFPFDKGWYFYTKPYKQGSTIFFPACGGRSPDKGILYLVSLHSICQLAGPGTDIQGLHFYFFSYSIGTIYSNSRSYGFAVRSAEEREFKCGLKKLQIVCSFGENYNISTLKIRILLYTKTYFVSFLSSLY